MKITFTPTEDEYRQVRLSEWRQPKNRRRLWIGSAVGFVLGYFYADARQAEIWACILSGGGLGFYARYLLMAVRQQKTKE